MTAMPPTLSPTEMLAADIGMDPEEVRGFAAVRYQLDLDDATDLEVASVREDLDSWYCVRSVPDIWAGELIERDTSVCRCRALGGLEHAPGPECPMPSRERRS